MNRARWERLDRLFVEALQRPPHERQTFLADETSDDPTLKEEVLSLLAAENRSHEFIERPALEQLARSVAETGWALSPGDAVGVYTIQHRLGAGGNGEVWRARDERLGRDVAIKVLLPHYAGNPENVRRFAEEARAVGSLSHANVLTVHDVGEHNGMPYLVSECLEGRTLRERLRTGGLPIAEAVSIAIALAQGLAAAHARGFVHRDLKPENVFLTSDDGVKILDFGLAALQTASPGVDPTTHSVTGTIVGTAGYLAPEQLRGEPADTRSDLFAIGIILYEMLTGQHPSKGTSVFETLHAILAVESPDVSTVNGDVPAPLGRITMRLLSKKQEARFQSARDLAWALEEVAAPDRAVLVTAERDSPRAPAPRLAWRWRFGAAALVAVGVFTGWSTQGGRSAAPPAPIRFTWSLPAGLALDSAPVVSPDGRHFAFVGRDEHDSRLFVRSLDSDAVRLIDGTAGAKQPFWSPDGSALGFFAKGKLARISLDGGAPVVLADAPDARGGTWSRGGLIVFSPNLRETALMRVSAKGGPAEDATLLDTAQGENGHRWPTFLPDGVHYLYFVRSTVDDRRGVYVGRVDGTAGTPGEPLLRTESEAYFAPRPDGTSGTLLYAENGRLHARAFDPARIAFTQDARALDVALAGQSPYHPALLSASAQALAWTSPTVPWGNRLVSTNRSGEVQRTWEEREVQNWPRISPDGRWLERQRLNSVTGNPDVWVEDLVRSTAMRVTTGPENDVLPVWSPDGRFIAYRSGPAASPHLRISTADGSGLVRTIPCPRPICEPTDWSPDGTHLIVNVNAAPQQDVWAVPANGSGTARAIVAEAASERDARMSPDGRWLAYVSHEGEQPEVMVRAMSGPAWRGVISSGGGDQPVWRRDGRELFFVAENGRLRVVSVHPAPAGGLTFGLTTDINVPLFGRGHWGTGYDVSPDGQTIYFLSGAGKERAPSHVNVLLNWRQHFGVP